MSEQNNATPVAEVLIHPLLMREIRPPRNWNEWRECWKESNTTHQLLGLLHGGFEVGFDQYEYGEHRYDRIDRLETYFAIADGWADGYYQLQDEADGDKSYRVGCDKHGNIQREPPWQLRQQLAQKAFDMLSRNFFKPQVEDATRIRSHHEDSWGADIVSGRLLQIVLGFFRVDEVGATRNISRRGESEHRMQHAINFLLMLIRVIFKWEEEKIESYTSEPEKVAKLNIETRQRIDSAKLWAIEVLATLHKLDLLWEMRGVQRDAWGKFVEIEEPCLAKLKEIALRAQLDRYSARVSVTRLAATLEEACYAGSKAAWFLKRYELTKAEHDRFSAIMREESEREETGRKEQERLQAIEQAQQARDEAARKLQELGATG